jgi:hypothetical protein
MGKFISLANAEEMTNRYQNQKPTKKRKIFLMTIFDAHQHVTRHNL